MARCSFIIALIFFWPETGVGQILNKNFYQIQKEMDMIYASPEARTGGYKQWKRAEYYLENRLGPHGEIVNAEQRKWDTWEKYLAPLARAPGRAYSGNWEFFGPYLIEGNPGIGRINRIAFHPTDPDILYAGTAGGGLCMTLNHGIDWAPLTESLPVNNISGIVVDYSDPDNVYIFTGDGDGCCGSARLYYLQKSSMGVLKSTNGGDTWQPTGLMFEEPDLIWPYDLVQHPEFPEILFAATNTGVFLTLNAGDSWSQMLETKVFELHFKPDASATLFAISDANVFRSSTLGITWDTIPIPLLDSLDGRMTLATCTQDPNIMYLVASPETADSAGFRGLFRTIDGGLTFDLVIDTPNIIDFQSSYDLTMACNPLDVNDIILGAVNHRKSTNGGISFTITGGTHADIHDLQINPLNNRLYSATDGGIYYSDDFGTTWTFISEYNAITQYYKMAVSQQDPEVIIAGAQDNGTHRNHELATQDMDRIHHSDGMDCAIHPQYDSLMIYSIQDGKFWISTNQGESEDSLIHASSLPSSVLTAWVTPIAWDPNDTNNIYIGYDPIYRSFDRGATFNPIPDTISGRRILHVAPANGQRLYAGDRYTVDENTNSFHLWTSMNQGTTWMPLHTSISFPDTAMVISGLCSHPDDDQEVWITLSGYVSGQKVYRSTDAGATWMNMSGSLPNTPINTFVLENTTGASNYAVYVGTDIGIFYTNALLGDWIPFSNGLPVVEISDLEISHSAGKILASTYGRGIWMADLFSSCEEVITVTYSMQNDDHNYFFQASDSIISNVPVDNSFGVQVLYRAGNAVLLTEGFRATKQHGAIFRALNGDCSEGGVPLPQMSPGIPASGMRIQYGFGLERL